LQNLRDLGNTMVVVEHDREVIAAADYLLDFGRGAGDRGGEITAQGPAAKVLRAESSLAADGLSGRKAIPVPPNRRLQRGPLGKYPTVKIVGARQTHLTNVDVEFTHPTTT